MPDPAGISLLVEQYSIPGTVVDEWCTVNPQDCCEDVAACADLPDELFITFAGVPEPPGSPFGGPPRKEYSGVGGSPLTAQLDDLSTLENRPYRMRRVLVLNPGASPEFRQHLYILSDSEPVATDSFFYHQKTTTTSGTVTTFDNPSETIYYVPGTFVTETGGYTVDTSPPNPFGWWLSPTGYPFTIDCDLSELTYDGPVGTQFYIWQSLPYVESLVPVGGLTSALPAYHSLTGCEEPPLGFIYYIPPSFTCSWVDSGVGTNLASSAMSSGATAKYKIHRQIYLTMGCIDGGDETIPFARVQFYSYITRKDTGHASYSYTYTDVSTLDEQTDFWQVRRYYIWQFANWDIADNYYSDDWSGTFPYVTIADNSLGSTVTITISP